MGKGTTRKRVVSIGGNSSSSGGTSPTNTTYGTLYTSVVTNNNATEGFYLLTDKADRGILVQVFNDTAGNNRVRMEAEGIFLNPDFQSVGVYTGVFGLTGVAYTSTQGVWYAAGEAGYINGDVVFWDGLHYQVIDSNAFQGLNPASAPGSFFGTPYQELPKATANVGYISDADYIEYDLILDAYIVRKDKRANIVYSHSSIDYFQWGNDSVHDNQVYGIMFCLNYCTAGMVGNVISNGINVNNMEQMTTTSTFNYNRLYPATTVGVYPYIVNMTGTNPIQEFDNNTIEVPDSGINFTDNSQGAFNGETMSGGNSTFRLLVDLAGSTTLTLGTAATYVGRIDIQDTTAIVASIDTISGIPNGRTIRMYPDTGLGGAALVVTFVHNTGANQPSCQGGVNAVIDSATSDWIEFTKQTRLNDGIYRTKQTNIGTY